MGNGRFSDVMKQLGVDVFEGEGWEKYDNKKNKIQNCHLDQNEIEILFIRLLKKYGKIKKLKILENIMQGM